MADLKPSGYIDTAVNRMMSKPDGTSAIGNVIVKDMGDPEKIHESFPPRGTENHLSNEHRRGSGQDYYRGMGYYGK